MNPLVSPPEPGSDLQEKRKSKTLRGKYQIKKNIFVTCYLDVEEATDKAFKAYLGLKKRYDALVPVGTKLYFNAESINKINARRSGMYDRFSCTVIEIETQKNGRQLHICTPILRETHPDRREQERTPTEFFLTHKETGAGFIAQNATVQGARLQYKATRAVLSLNLGQSAHFEATYKGVPYRLTAEIIHIQYDWKAHAHLVGIRFRELDQECETILNLLIDPNYRIDITSNQTINPAEGKISRDF